MSTRRISEETVETADGAELRVRRERDQVIVVWSCGDEFPFKWQRLREALFYIEQFASRDIWVTLKDSDGEEFMAWLDGGHLRVRRNTNSEESLPWDDLRPLLGDALAEGEKHEQEQTSA